MSMQCECKNFISWRILGCRNMNFQKIVSFFVAIFFALFLILLSFQLYLYNNFFYDWQYEMNGVYTRFGYNETWTATHELWNYMHFQGEFYSVFFSERDQQHMIDVRNIIHVLTQAFFFFGLLTLFFLFVDYFFSQQSWSVFVSSLCFRTSILLFLVLVFFFCAALFFDTAFLWFHKIFFFNDLWLLNPATDRLIILYPESFFFTIVLFIFLTVLLFSIVLFFLAKHLCYQKSI